MANSFDLSQKPGRQALYASLKRNLRREDFPADDQGWKWFAQHKVDKYTDQMAEAARNLEYWKSVSGGEHLTKVADLVAELAKAQAQAAELAKQLEAAKKPEPKQK